VFEKQELWAFPGLHFFNDNSLDRELFFGRKKEIKELTERIIAKDITIVMSS